MPDITVVLTAHREGVLAGPTARSACAAIEHARSSRGLSIEVIVVLDRPTRDTRQVLEHGLSRLQEVPIRVLEVETGDPGQSRNIGIAEAAGSCSTFLDGDDLWSQNWLSAAWDLIEARPDAVAQSMCNVVFGEYTALWWHVDSESGLFDPDYLGWANYWDAMSFARTDIYRRFPFKANDLKLGFGHEDWHWSVVTYQAGIAHKPVPGTIHFKRRRSGSQMSLVESAGGVVWPSGPLKDLSDERA
jgi:glycosyltransferase involved in cell wall biosynthesis